MENNKTKTIAIDFSKDKKRALKILADEKKAREAIRKKHAKNEEVELPKYVEDIMFDQEIKKDSK